MVQAGDHPGFVSEGIRVARSECGLCVENLDGNRTICTSVNPTPDLPHATSTNAAFQVESSQPNHRHRRIRSPLRDVGGQEAAQLTSTGEKRRDSVTFRLSTLLSR